MKKLLRNLSVLCLVFAAVFNTGCYREELPFLTVDHEVVLVGPQTDKATVVVESNVDWAATSSVAWITVDNGFGNHKGTFEFFVEANTTPNERSGKITIEGGTCTVTILVRQQSEGSILTLATDKLLFTKDADEYLMNLACNGEWKVSTSADWCKVTPASGDGNGSFTVTVEENNTGADRTAEISVLTTADGVTQVRTVTVTQTASNAALVVSPESKQLTCDASTFELDVITVGTWAVSLDSDWLTMSATEGEGDAQLTVSATKNDTGRERIAIITFATGAENENRVVRQIVVRQTAVDFYLVVPVTDYPLSLEAQTIEIPYELEGSNVTVNVSSNAKWMSVGTVSDGVATVNVEENTTALAREGVISFITQGQDGDPIVRQVRVAQAPTINLLDVLADEYAVEWTGETFRIPIYSITPVTARSTDSWCQATVDGQDVVITVPENTTSYERTAVVTVTTNSDKGEILSRTTVIRQAAAYSELVVTPEAKNIYAIAQSFVASIITNNSWTANSDSDWLTIDKAEGTGDYMLTVTAAENKTGQVRVATVTIQTGIENSKRESATITVTQRPEQFYFEVPTRSYLIDKWGGKIDVPYTTSGNEESVVASSNVDWLRVGDVADGIVALAATENKTDEVRTGVVTVTCTPVFGDPISISVTVTQSPTVNVLDVFVDEITASAKGDEVALPYYANTPVSVSSSEAWVHAEVTVDEDSFKAECCSYSDPQKIIKIEVDPNRTAEARVAYVTISTVSDAGEKITKVIKINQPSLYAALSVNPKSVVLPAHNAEFILTINTTGTWLSTVDCTWLSTEDDTAGFGDATIFIKAGVNDTGAERKGSIIVATGGENNAREEQVVSVVQLSRDTYLEIPIAAYALSKLEQVLNVGYFAAGDFKDMQVNCSEDWITFDSAYSDETTLAFDVAENTTAEPRTATVTVTLDLVAGEPLTDTFIVSQAPTINILDVYVKEINASAWGQKDKLPFYGNTDVEAVSSAPWCTVRLHTDTDPQTVTIVCDENATAEARTAYVTVTTVTDKGEKLTHIITVNQKPLNAALTVSPETVVLPAHNAEFTLTIVSDGTWETMVDCNWLHTSDEISGDGDGTILLEADDNVTGAQREATLVIWTGAENETRISKEVKIIQLARDTYVDVPQQAYILPKEANAEFEVKCLIAGDVKNVLVDCSEPWIKWVDGDMGYLLFDVKENVTGAPRTATVTVTIDKVNGEPATDTFTVTQAGTYNMLEVLQDYVVLAAEGEVVWLPALTNVEDVYAWPSVDWIDTDIDVDTYTTNPNSEDAFVKVAAYPNTTGYDRTGTVVVTADTEKGETITKKIKVFQPAAETFFAVLTGKNMLVTKAESDVTIEAYASVNADKVEMRSNAPWLTVKTAPAVEGETLVKAVFTASENVTGSRRQAEVTVTFFDEKGDTVQETVQVSQADKDGSVLEALLDAVVLAAEGESIDLTFETEDVLTATPSAPWITAAIDASQDPQVLTITAAENATGNDRTGYVTVSNGSESVLIKVFQPAKETVFAVWSPDIVYLDKADQTFKVEGWASVNSSSVQTYSNSSWLTKDGGLTSFGSMWNQGFEVTENTTGADRIATIKVTFVDDMYRNIEKTVTVVQAGSPYILDAMLKTISVLAEGETKIVGYLASSDLAFGNPDSDWLTVHQLTSGSMGGVLEIEAAANDTGRDRTSKIQLASEEGKTDVITVFQPAKNSDFAVFAADVIFITREAQDVLIQAYNANNVDGVAMLSSSAWLAYDSQTPFGDINIQTFKAAENTTGEERIATVKVNAVDKDGNVQQGEVTVIQSATSGGSGALDALVSDVAVAAAGEDLTLSFVSTDDLTASSSSGWLTVAVDNSADPKTVTLTAAANETGLDRTAYVTVSNGTSTEVVKVFQPAAVTDFAVLSPDVFYVTKEAQQISLSAYASEKPEQITFVPNASWLAFDSDGELGNIKVAKFNVEENTTGADRTSTVLVTYLDAKGVSHQGTITVVQASGVSANAILEAMVDELAVAAEGEQVVLSFMAEDQISAYASSASWLKAVTVDAANSQVAVEADPNNTGKDRVGYFTVKNSSKMATVKVFQPAAATEFAVITPVKAITSEVQTVALRAFCSSPVTESMIRASSDAEWLTLGAIASIVPNIAIIPATADANLTGAPRTAVVTITWVDEAGKVHTGEATVMQSASDNYLDVYASVIDMPAAGGETTMDILSNCTSFVPKSSNSEWLVATVTGGTEFTLTVAENDTDNARKAYVTITATFADGTSETKVIEVNQSGTALYFVLPVEEFGFDADAYDFTVDYLCTENPAADVKAYSSADWVSAVGLTTNPLQFHVYANTASAARHATVDLYYTAADADPIKVTFHVLQAGIVYDFALTATTFDLTVDEQTFNVAYTSVEDPATNVVVTSAPAWVSAVDLSANPLVFKVEENTTGVVRSDDVTIQYTAPDATVFTKTFTVNQDI